MKWPRKKSMARLRESIRQRTRRQNGLSLREIIGGVNAVPFGPFGCAQGTRELRAEWLRGWYDYFKHSKANALETVDGFVRRRLRSPFGRLRAWRQRWPNAYFAAQGLFCLSGAQAACPQSR